jgi:phospholipid transport system substrate-binding protein
MGSTRFWGCRRHGTAYLRRSGTFLKIIGTRRGRIVDTGQAQTSMCSGTAEFPCGLGGTEEIEMRRLISLWFALFLGAGLFLADGNAALAQQNEVRGFYDTLLTTMKNGRTLGQSGRYARLVPAVDRVFDIPLMTRLSIGATWPSLTPAQQQQVTEAFRHYVTATYADRFDSFSGEQLQVTGERPYNGDVIVETKIINSKGEPTTLNYRMSRRQGPWQISDVYLDGTISQLAVHRSEFNSVLRREGVDGLTVALNRKVDLLGRGVAKVE